ALAIPDFPLAFGRVLPPLVTPLVAVRFAHRIGAVIVALSVATTVARAARSPRAELRRPALVAAALVVVQVALGASIIWTRRAVVPTTSHVALGAALLATCFALTLRAVRLGVRRSAEPVPIGFRREVPACGPLRPRGRWASSRVASPTTWSSANPAPASWCS